MAGNVSKDPQASHRRPVIIAHRGASGYLPEHSLAAKALAHQMGADYLEQDVVATRDGQLIVFHDLYLDDVTDIAGRFPGRARADGRHYCIDFDLDEIRTLRITERRKDGKPRFPKRKIPTGETYRIPTLAEELAFIADLNAGGTHRAGIYTEIKEPAWHRDHGIDLGKWVLGTLATFGYSAAEDQAIIQCFDAEELKRLRRELGTRLPLVLLLEGDQAVPDAKALTEMAGYAQGIGPSIRLLNTSRDSRHVSSLVADAHGAGLVVHPYTVRDDDVPKGFHSSEALIRVLMTDQNVDGIFADFPDTASQHIEAGANR